MKNLAVKKVVYELGYRDFEKMVYEAWPAQAPKPVPSCPWIERGWEYPADEECGNDTARTYDVDANPIPDYDQEDLDNFAAGNHQQYMAGRLLDALCRIGVLEPGRYVVEVSW